MHDGVDFANMAQKLVAKPFAMACASNEACDVDKLDACRRYFLSVIHLSQHFKSLVRHIDHADVWLNRAKRIVGALSASFCDSVKKCALANVWQTDNSDFHFLFLLNAKANAFYICFFKGLCLCLKHLFAWLF